MQILTSIFLVKKTEASKTLTMINIEGNINVSIYNNTLPILIQFFIHLHVRLEIETKDRKFSGNRVDTYQCPTTKLITGYLLMGVSPFLI